MSSLRTILIAIFPLIASITFLCTRVREATVTTKDWRDVTVVGRGYFQTLDQNNASPLWLKNLTLTLDTSNQLCTKFDGKLRRIEPPLNIPFDWTKINVHQDGTVLISTATDTDLNVGCLSLWLFSGDAESPVLTEEDISVSVGIPVDSQPGSGGAGLVQQFSNSQLCLPITFSSVVAIGIIGFSIVYLLWTANSGHTPV